MINHRRAKGEKMKNTYWKMISLRVSDKKDTVKLREILESCGIEKNRKVLIKHPGSESWMLNEPLIEKGEWGIIEKALDLWLKYRSEKNKWSVYRNRYSLSSSAGGGGENIHFIHKQCYQKTKEWESSWYGDHYAGSIQYLGMKVTPKLKKSIAICCKCGIRAPFWVKFSSMKFVDEKKEERM